MKYLTHFDFINIDGDQNTGQKRIPLRIRSFLSLVVHLKKFGHSCLYHICMLKPNEDHMNAIHVQMTN